MEFNTLFWVALQSGLVLGLIHGVNPCGHSWLVLAPFVCGERSGRRVFGLTFSFIAGTSLGCLAIGLTLGAVSLAIPPSFAWYVDVATFLILLGLGGILIVKPSLLHSHGSHDSHGHDHDGHRHVHDHRAAPPRSLTLWGLFALGFANMIVPCPTVAIMYSYALDSGSMFKGTMVFAAYALGTGLALGVVIYMLYKAVSRIRTLERKWIEPAVMRTAGFMTMAFGVYSLYSA